MTPTIFSWSIIFFGYETIETHAHSYNDNLVSAGVLKVKKVMVEKFMDEIFMVDNSGVEKAGIEAWGSKIRGGNVQ